MSFSVWPLASHLLWSLCNTPTSKGFKVHCNFTTDSLPLEQSTDSLPTTYQFPFTSPEIITRPTFNKQSLYHSRYLYLFKTTSHNSVKSFLSSTSITFYPSKTIVRVRRQSTSKSNTSPGLTLPLFETINHSTAF